ncbi:HAD family hydrolase [Chondromyces crocatus]|uniref:Haloacid dehalogenase n=1 Tax=Chondromyces crocatus TaxID=52 RepID=A0A0K1E7X9_CHOCO|nr:HAD family hydrolase [Chondromyces crocatus]AKT36668.1 haloacid dehalogenase [Chondromyces crocatus]
MTSIRAVSFDFGQTLAELDTAMLSRRLLERGVRVPVEQLEGAVPSAWEAYNTAIHRGESGHPWKTLMSRLLEVAGVEATAASSGGAGNLEAAGRAGDAEGGLGRSALVDWLWDEQPRRNLWRRPIAGMIELVEELQRAGIPVAVLSNSEGRLAELADELGWRARFVAIADSGKLGFEKPGREIFAWTAAALGVSLEHVAHVGDSLAADVEGALAAGMRAVWFGGESRRIAGLGERVAVASDAAGVRAALQGFGLSFP